MKGYNVNGTREIVEVATEALATLPRFIESLGEDAEVAEFHAYENMPVEVTIGVDWGFFTYVWNREAWILLSY